MYIDRILLVYLIAPSSVGLYVVAVNMAQPMKEIGWSIALVLFPKASGYERDQAIDVSGLATRADWLNAEMLALVELEPEPEPEAQDDGPAETCALSRAPGFGPSAWLSLLAATLGFLRRRRNVLRARRSSLL